MTGACGIFFCGVPKQTPRNEHFDQSEVGELEVVHEVAVKKTYNFPLHFGHK